MLQIIEKDLAEAAPDFTAIDAANRQIILSGFRSKLNVVLVFNRGFV